MQLSSCIFRGESPKLGAERISDEGGQESESVTESVRPVTNTSVWDTFANYYPSFSGDEEWGIHNTTLPKLGIQRPSVRAGGHSEGISRYYISKIIYHSLFLFSLILRVYQG